MDKSWLENRIYRLRSPLAQAVPGLSRTQRSLNNRLPIIIAKQLPLKN
jgi:3-phenylpropionate/cinnamic acid dioxygenase small subunit